MAQKDGRCWRGIAATGLLGLLLALAGCSQIGLVYNRLDTLVHFEMGNYVDLDPAQQADFDARFNKLWRWHRTTQLPIYARQLRQLAQTAQAPLDAAQIRDIGERLQPIFDTTSTEILNALAPVLASLSDAQVDALAINIAKQSDKAHRKNQKLDDAHWRDKRRDDAVDRLDDWAGSVTPPQRERIGRWARDRVRPTADADAVPMAEFAALLKTRHDAGFEARLRASTQPSDNGDEAMRFERARDASTNLLADLSQMATPPQRAHLRKKLEDLAGELDVLAKQ